jgi:hypothetical protein
MGGLERGLQQWQGVPGEATPWFGRRKCMFFSMQLRGGGGREGKGLNGEPAKREGNASGAGVHIPEGNIVFLPLQ